MRHILFFTLLFLSLNSIAQSDSTSLADSNRYVIFSTPTESKLDLNKKEAPKEFKKKKMKRKVFYGYKTRKSYSFHNKGQHTTTEIFFYLKKWEDPNTYIKDIYWFDPIKQKIIKSHKYDPVTSKLLHGPYVRMVDDIVVEEGIYYLGVKHGRWSTWKKTKHYTIHDTIEIEENQLLTKKKYNRGWPKEAEITYHDSQQKRYKEILPYNAEEKLDGEYFKYFKSGRLAEYGVYRYGYKTGRWVTYHDNKGKRHFKKEILIYPRKPFYPKDEEPFIYKQWNEKGKVSLDNQKVYEKIRDKKR